MTEGDAIEREIFVAAAPDIVFGFLIDATLMAKWIGLFHTLDSRPGDSDPRCARTVLGLADTFNNESVIDRPVFAVLGDALVGLAVIPILCGFHVREFRNDDSLNRITFKDFVLSIGYERFDRMTLRRCLDSGPIFFELLLIDGFSSREYNVCRHDRFPSLLSDCRNSHANSWAVARVVN
jgi:hypothetical protein